MTAMEHERGRRALLIRSGAAAGSLLIPAAAKAAPGGALTVLIIRHAEKPDEAWPGPGMSATGAADPKSLVIRGWQRAGAWAALFGGSLGGRDYPKPTAIYAADPKPAPGDDASARPFETISPLAAKLNLKANIAFALGQERELAADIDRLSGVVLICWEHKAIASALLPAIVGGQPMPTLPRKWDGTRFDLALRFDRPNHDAPWAFRELFPRLLSGDTDAAME